MDPELLRARARASVGAEGRASPLTRAQGWARAPRAGRAEGRGLRSPPSLRSVVRCAAVQTPTVGSASRGEAGAFHR